MSVLVLSNKKKEEFLKNSIDQNINLVYANGRYATQEGMMSAYSKYFGDGLKFREDAFQNKIYPVGSNMQAPIYKCFSETLAKRIEDIQRDENVTNWFTFAFPVFDTEQTCDLTITLNFNKQVATEVQPGTPARTTGFNYETSYAQKTWYGAGVKLDYLFFLNVDGLRMYYMMMQNFNYSFKTVKKLITYKQLNLLPNTYLEYLAKDNRITVQQKMSDFFEEESQYFNCLNTSDKGILEVEERSEYILQRTDGVCDAWILPFEASSKIKLDPYNNENRIVGNLPQNSGINNNWDLLDDVRRIGKTPVFLQREIKVEDNKIYDPLQTIHVNGGYFFVPRRDDIDYYNYKSKYRNPNILVLENKSDRNVTLQLKDILEHSGIFNKNGDPMTIENIKQYNSSVNKDDLKDDPFFNKVVFRDLDISKKGWEMCAKSLHGKVLKKMKLSIEDENKIFIDASIQIKREDDMSYKALESSKDADIERLVKHLVKLENILKELLGEKFAYNEWILAIWTSEGLLSTDPLSAMVAAYKTLTFNLEQLNRLIENDIEIPISFLCVRPTRNLVMKGGMKIKTGGGTLINTTSNFYVIIDEDAMSNKFQLQANGQMGSKVISRKNLYKKPNLILEYVLSGFNEKMFKIDERLSSKRIRISKSDIYSNTNESIFVFAVPYDFEFEKLNNVIDITGGNIENPLIENSQFPTAFRYSKIWGFENTHADPITNKYDYQFNRTYHENLEKRGITRYCYRDTFHMLSPEGKCKTMFGKKPFDYKYDGVSQYYIHGKDRVNVRENTFKFEN